MTDRTLALEVNAVRKIYQRGATALAALDGVSLTVTRGEFVAIMGPSGSGKSTLMHLIGALDQPNEGDVRISGRSLKALSRKEVAQIRTDHIGFVFQAFNLIPGLTALENISLPALLARRSVKTATKRAAELLERVDLSEFAHATPAEMSGGQQQRVAIARALVMDPAIVLADEPTGNLDSHAGNEVLELLEENVSKERTLIIVTHDQRVAARANRIITLRDGKIAEELTNPARKKSPRASTRRLVRVGDSGPAVNRERRS